MASALCQVSPPLWHALNALLHFVMLNSSGAARCCSAVCSRARVTASLKSPAGARLISFTDVIEIKGAAAAVAAKEKESKEAELAMLQASCSSPLLLRALHPAVRAHHLATSSSSSSSGHLWNHPQQQLTHQGAVSRIVAAVAHRDGRCVRAAAMPRAQHRHITAVSGQLPPTSRAAAAKRIGGGFDKGAPSASFTFICERDSCCAVGVGLAGGSGARPPVPVPTGK
jgi:hypothetical protein